MDQAAIARWLETGIYSDDHERLQSVTLELTDLPFFFSSRRRHTRCGRDWSSDVCSSDLDLALHEAQSRWIRVDRARKSVPTNNGEFAARVAALKQRIDALQGRLAENQQRLTGYLAQLAVHELEEQKGRLAAYQVQARF